MENAWNEDKQAFTQNYQGNDLDASVLLMEDYGFISAEDVRYVSTVKAIEKELMMNGLMDLCTDIKIKMILDYLVHHSPFVHFG